MKQFLTILLAGLLTVPTAGCASPDAAAARPQDAAAEDGAGAAADASRRMAELYQISLDAAGQELSELTSEINAVPVQTRPVSDEAAAVCEAYFSRIRTIEDAIDGSRAQIAGEYKEKNLLKDDYDALAFQCDQLTARADALRSTLNVTYGACFIEDEREEENADAA